MKNLADIDHEVSDLNQRKHLGHVSHSFLVPEF